MGLKLTIAAAKAHQRACDLLAIQRPLTMGEREFVLRHWQESQNSTTVTTMAGAFFTPLDLAKDLALHVSGAVRLIDLGAGIGALAWAAYRKMVAGYLSPPPVEIVCVERNPEYVAVGRRVLPEAEWLCADLFALPDNLRRVDRGFDVAISCARLVSDQGCYTARAAHDHNLPEVNIYPTWVTWWTISGADLPLQYVQVVTFPKQLSQSDKPP